MVTSTSSCAKRTTRRSSGASSICRRRFIRFATGQDFLIHVAKEDDEVPAGGRNRAKRRWPGSRHESAISTTIYSLRATSLVPIRGKTYLASSREVSNIYGYARVSTEGQRRAEGRPIRVCKTSVNGLTFCSAEDARSVPLSVV